MLVQRSQHTEKKTHFLFIEIKILVQGLPTQGVPPFHQHATIWKLYQRGENMYEDYTTYTSTTYQLTVTDQIHKLFIRAIPNQYK